MRASFVADCSSALFYAVLCLRSRGTIARYLSAAVEEYGLDVLRMDYNLDPGPIWQTNDKEGRSGMVEVAYIEGLYTMWDEILATHPGLLIDDCSSGGRRIDIETLARSFPLWRSDNGGSAAAPGAVTLQIRKLASSCCLCLCLCLSLVSAHRKQGSTLTRGLMCGGS